MFSVQETEATDTPACREMYDRFCSVRAVVISKQFLMINAIVSSPTVLLLAFFFFFSPSAPIRAKKKCLMLKTLKFDGGNRTQQVFCFFFFKEMAT